MTDDRQAFTAQTRASAAQMGADPRMQELTSKWINAAAEHSYSYNFEWLGLPIIQYPQDIVALQEVIWRTRPDLIVETGVARGGSVIFYASMLELLGGQGRVLGIDVDIRDHNREAIESHPLATRIDLLEGSSVDAEIVGQAKRAAASAERVMVVLDSNHTHKHVLAELRSYAPLVTEGAYLVVLDTIVAHMPEDAFPDRPWSLEANPKTAVAEFLAKEPAFEIDGAVDDRLLISVAPGGYLRRTGPPSDGR